MFELAGLMGIFLIVPLYFYEPTVSGSQVPLTHPEFYYGFLGVALAWQVAFLVIATDPAKYRALIPAALLDKLLYPAAVAMLFVEGRVRSPAAIGGAAFDLVWLVLFALAWSRLGRNAGAIPGAPEAVPATRTKSPQHPVTIQESVS